jgi:hypothetical protein
MTVADEERRMIRVRATQDGTYNGFSRLGPKEEADGSRTEGDIFTVDATPYVVKDEWGHPVLEMDRDGQPVSVLNEKGEPKIDKATGKKVFRVKMATMFSPEWMEPVNDDATVTAPREESALGVLPDYQEKKAGPKKVAAKPTKLPQDIQDILNKDASGPGSETVI